MKDHVMLLEDESRFLTAGTIGGVCQWLRAQKGLAPDPIVVREKFIKNGAVKIGKFRIVPA